MSPLRSPEQVAEDLGRDENGELHLPALTIRRLVRDGAVKALRGPRNKVLFDDAAVEQLLATLRDPEAVLEGEGEPELELEGNPFGFRSRRSA